MTDPIQWLRDDFRHQLEVFYARLKLAPPYHSLEKAILTLVSEVKAMTPEARARVVADPSLTWREYNKAFVRSELHLKHRGIISGLIRSNQVTNLPAEHDAFLNAYRADLSNP